jgi:hypothetical protein
MAMTDHTMKRMRSWLRRPVAPGHVRLQCEAERCNWIVWAWPNPDTPGTALQHAQQAAREHKESQRVNKRKEK